jgi:hypothetical protein
MYRGAIDSLARALMGFRVLGVMKKSKIRL